jgi:hypothetical protein
MLSIVIVLLIFTYLKPLSNILPEIVFRPEYPQPIPIAVRVPVGVLVFW